MYIDDKNKFIYFHIAKTGGTSIRMILKDHFRMDWNRLIKRRLSLRGAKGVLAPTGDHVPLSELLQLFPRDEQLLLSYKKWSFVRNPYNIVYSNWLYNEAYYKQMGRVKMPFSNFVRHMTSTNWQSPYLWHEGRFVMDFVGCFENYKQDLGLILKDCNVKYKEIYHANKLGDNKYLKFYNRSNVRIVNEHNKDIFKTFGYTMLDPNLFPEEVDPNNFLQIDYDDSPKYLRNGKLILTDQ